jgi:hypothetical protein
MDPINFVLFKACHRYNLEEIRSAANLGANVNYGLMGACYSGNEDLVAVLISSGATDLGGCLIYSKNLKIARLLINRSSSIDIVNFLKKIFTDEVSYYYPFRGTDMKFEMRINNLEMREDYENLKYIIRNCGVIRTLRNAKEYNLKKLFQISVECLDLNKICAEDMSWLLDKNIENYINNFELFSNKYDKFNRYLVLLQYISYKRLLRISRILPGIPRFYYKFNKISDKKIFGKKVKNLYNLNINKDPVYILLTGSYDKNNKNLYNLPIDILRLLDTYI